MTPVLSSWEWYTRSREKLWISVNNCFIKFLAMLVFLVFWPRKPLWNKMLNRVLLCLLDTTALLSRCEYALPCLLSRAQSLMVTTKADTFVTILYLQSTPIYLNLIKFFLRLIFDPLYCTNSSLLCHKICSTLKTGIYLIHL